MDDLHVSHMPMRYTYIKSESDLYTVGFYDVDDKWHPESDHGNREDAANRVTWLNEQSATKY